MFHGGKFTDMNGVDKVTFDDEEIGSSGDGLRVFAGPLNESEFIGPQGADKKRMWTRLARMDYGLVDLLKEGAKSILGKRISQGQQHEVFGSVEEHTGKRIKSGDVSQTIEVVGVSKHPCRAQ